MANQTLPIILKANPVPSGARAADLNQLIALVAQYITGSVSAAIDFFRKGAVDPNSNVGIFFNTVSQVFKVWNSTAGKYEPITNLNIGDVKQSFTVGDELSRGWIQLNGRAKTNVVGISTSQLAALNSIFPGTDFIPDLKLLASVALPPNNSFSSIPVADILPANGVIGGATFSSTYVQAEAEVLRDLTEILRDSDSNLQQSVLAIRIKSEALLVALNSSASGAASLYTKVWAGFP